MGLVRPSAVSSSVGGVIGSGVAGRAIAKFHREHFFQLSPAEGGGIVAGARDKQARPAELRDELTQPSHLRGADVLYAHVAHHHEGHTGTGLSFVGGKVFT